MNSGFGVRLVLNGFPKSGLHLVELMTRCILQPYLYSNWIGSISESSWGTEWQGIDRSVAMLEWMSMGTYVKGHLGFRPELTEVLDKGAIGMVFVFRDPRDVLCSALRHIEQPNGQHFIHPGRELLLQLPDKGQRLIALLEGFSVYGGLFERWDMYTPWLTEENVLPLPYEYVRGYPREASELLVRYALGRSSIPNGVLPQLHRDDLERHTSVMEQAMTLTEQSSTYIKGSLGGWQEEFTPTVTRRFKELAGDWLEHLGYETGKDW